MTKRNRSKIIIVLGAVLVFVGVSGLLSGSGPGEPEPASLSTVVNAISDGRAASAELNENNYEITLTLTNGQRIASSYPETYGTDLANLLIEEDVIVESEPLKGDSLARDLLLTLLPLGLIILFLIFYLGRKGAMGVGKLDSKKGQVEVPDVKFSDVAGCDEAVDEMQEFTEFLHDPAKFQRSGARVPRGALLVGPPGTGKTLLARAVAGEAGVPFFSVSGSDFIEVFVGVGASRVRQLFEKARKAERAIVFIDEIDAIGKTRGAGGPGGGGNDEREQTLNQLLVEMDGFEKSNIIVLAATNRPDTLDPALLRPGRFDRQVHVPPPDRKGRTDILELYARSRRISPDVDMVALARRTPGFTGAELENLMNEAAIITARAGRDEVTPEDMENAVQSTVMGRARKSAVVSDEDRRITAWHEAGHAVSAFVLEHANDPVQVSIVPRGRAGGVTWMSGDDDSFMTKKKAEAQLVVALSGRAAEERLLGDDFTQGAAGDFQSATQLAAKMVTEFGMSDLGVAHLSPELISLGNQADKVLDAVNRMLDHALDTARATLDVNAELVEAVANELLAEDVIDLDRIKVLSRAHVVVQPETSFTPREPHAGLSLVPGPRRFAGLRDVASAVAAVVRQRPGRPA